MLGRRNGNCRWSRLGKSGVEAYSDDTLGAVLRKTKNRRIVVLEIRILEGAGISTDGEIENIPYLRISNRHLR
jgi:hypothetical protein